MMRHKVSSQGTNNNNKRKVQALLQSRKRLTRRAAMLDVHICSISLMSGDRGKVYRQCECSEGTTSGSYSTVGSYHESAPRFLFSLLNDIAY
jgi:hypothetical protein